MSFEIRIRERENPDNTVFAGQFADAPATCNTNNSCNLIEIAFQGTIKQYRPVKTIIESDIEPLAKFFLQSLESFPHNPEDRHLYLKGSLINDIAKKILLYTSENDNDPKQVFIATLPRSGNDYIKIDDTCYRCKKIKFTEEGIKVIAYSHTCTFNDFEDHFYEQPIA